MTVLDTCPHCGSPQREAGGGRRTFVVGPIRTLGLFYQCPDCHGRWHRWPIGSDLYKRAEKYVNGGT